LDVVAREKGILLGDLFGCDVCDAGTVVGDRTVEPDLGRLGFTGSTGGLLGGCREAWLFAE
jgi:hypothetical protein